MFRRLVSWLLPAVCPGCHRDLQTRGPVCDACWEAVSPPAPAPLPVGIDRYQALAAFEPPLRELILSFKYRGKDYLGRSLGEWMGENAARWTLESHVIVPVPSPTLRRIARGYHPADVLASALGKRLNRPTARYALRRRHGFPSQTALDRQDRAENAERSFSSGWHTGPLKGCRVLLVDDVSTTGATLSACARLLRISGARSVDAVVLAQEALKASGKPPKPPAVPLLDAALG